MKSDFQVSSNYSNNHLEMISNSTICGCYYCEHNFTPEQIEEWIDKVQTALCPFCGIDAVLPEHQDYNVEDKKFLHDMHRYWFKIESYYEQ